MRQNCNGEDCDVALAAMGASFDAAQHIDYYEEQQIPEYGTKEEWVERTESGWFGDYRVLKKQTTSVQIGTNVKKIPIFKQKTFTPGDMEDIKDFLEHKAMRDVLQLAPGQGPQIPK